MIGYDLGGSIILVRSLKKSCRGIHGCQDVVRIWQDLAKTAKMLVRGSTRVLVEVEDEIKTLQEINIRLKGQTVEKS